VTSPPEVIVTKFVWVEPLKTKSGLEVANAFLKIIQQAIEEKSFIIKI
jgi:hypothetical protein